MENLIIIKLNYLNNVFYINNIMSGNLEKMSDVEMSDVEMSDNEDVNDDEETSDVEVNDPNVANNENMDDETMDVEKNYDIETSSEEDSDEEDDDEIKKLETSVNKDILLKYHPEITQINYNELHTLSKVVFNKSGIPIDPLHKTLPILTKYEKARVLGLRAKQINHGSDIFVEVPPSIFDGYTIAKMELEQKKIPFIIRRPLPNGTSEYWNVNDLQLLD